MIPIASLLFPGISAGLNRKWRGDGEAPRWAWYLFMTTMIYAVTGDVIFSGIWLFFLFGYALLAWQAMFSAINGQPPGRQDAWYAQWMQTLTLWINKRLPAIGVTENWYRYGMIYGAIRATAMLPAIFMLCGYTGSWIPMTGLLLLSMGYTYKRCGDYCAYIGVPRGTGVGFAEMVMGWCIMTYGVICAAVL